MNNGISSFVSALGGIAIVLNLIGSAMISTGTGEFNLALFLVLVVFGSALGALLIGLGEVINQLAQMNQNSSVPQQSSTASSPNAQSSREDYVSSGDYVVPKIKREDPSASQAAPEDSDKKKQVVCPQCHAIQQPNRTTCWKCGEKLN